MANLKNTISTTISTYGNILPIDNVSGKSVISSDHVHPIDMFSNGPGSEEYLGVYGGEIKNDLYCQEYGNFNKLKTGYDVQITFDMLENYHGFIASCVHGEQESYGYYTESSGFWFNREKFVPNYNTSYTPIEKPKNITCNFAIIVPQFYNGSVDPIAWNIITDSYSGSLYAVSEGMDYLSIISRWENAQVVLYGF